MGFTRLSSKAAFGLAFAAIVFFVPAGRASAQSQSPPPGLKGYALVQWRDAHPPTGRANAPARGPVLVSRPVSASVVQQGVVWLNADSQFPPNGTILLSPSRPTYPPLVTFGCW